jgi:hypothetical protein
MDIHKRIPRGKTWYNGNTIDTNNLGGTDYEGRVGFFVNRAVRSGTGPNTMRTRGKDEVVAILVRNVSGINLLPGRVCSYWASGYAGKRVAGYVTTTAARASGVVDEHLPAAGVPTNDMFWLVVKGPTLVRIDIAAAGANISEFDRLVALTAATSQCTTAGRVLTQVATGATGVLAADIQNVIGTALSGRTTADTAGLCLVDVGLL